MTNSALLAETIKSSGMTKTYIAREMGCSRMRLYSIIAGSECTVSEMQKLSGILRLSSRQKRDIFLV